METGSMNDMRVYFVIPSLEEIPMHTRRSFLKASSAALLLAAIPATRAAFAQSGDYELICTSDGVRVRSTPGLSGAIVGSVNIGAGVRVTGTSINADGYSWIPVNVIKTGTNGWVASQFFETPGGGGGWPRGTTVNVTSSNVNLRSGPGLGNAVIGSYNTGTAAVVQDGPRNADGYAWYNIDIAGRNGWMAADFLGQSDSPAPPPPSGGGFKAGAYVRPTSSLNLRSGAGTGHKVIRVYSPSNAATIIEGPTPAGGHNWYKVEMWDDGNVGWLAGEFLELARFEPTGSRHRVIDGPLNLRAGGGLDYALVASLQEGTVVVIKDASFGEADGYTWMWVYVEDHPGLTGWIAMGFTEEI